MPTSTSLEDWSALPFSATLWGRCTAARVVTRSCRTRWGLVLRHTLLLSLMGLLVACGRTDKPASPGESGAASGLRNSPDSHRAPGGRERAGQQPSKPVPPGLAKYVSRAGALGRALYENDLMAARATDVAKSAGNLDRSRTLRGWIVRKVKGTWCTEFVGDRDGAGFCLRR